MDTEICCRCGHTWIPRIDNPIVCPKCKSPYWDKERQNAQDADEIPSDQDKG